MLMDSLLSNAALATLLAVAVLAVTRFWRHPPVVYWLWFLVLLKLVTPAVLPLPVLVASESETTQRPVTPLTMAEAEALLATAETAEAENVAITARPLDTGHSSSWGLEGTSAAPTTAARRYPSARPQPPVTTETAPKSVFASLDWRTVAATVWVAGSLLWILLAVVRVVQFGRLAAKAESAPDWLPHEAQQIADRYGLRRCPRIRVVDARIPPVVWAVHTRPVVLLPSPLVAELSREQLAALLAHELAHVRRGDHWVRRLEMLVLAVYWWHPVAWLARRRMQEAEELCCDAWVTWSRPAASRGYADALLQTVDFLSGPLRPAPVGASGVGPVRLLERRIQMILSKRSSRRLSWKSGLFVLAASVLVLPWSAWAQDDAGGESPEASAESNEAVATDEAAVADDFTVTDESVADFAVVDDAAADRPRDSAAASSEASYQRALELYQEDEGNVRRARRDRAEEGRDPDGDRFERIVPLTLAGIGASLRNDGDYTVVQSLIPGGAADRGGSLKPNDRIVGVGEGVRGAIEDIVDIRLSDVARKLRGVPGSVVTLAVIPAGESERKLITITRDVIELQDNEARDGGNASGVLAEESYQRALELYQEDTENYRRSRGREQPEARVDTARPFLSFGQDAPPAQRDRDRMESEPPRRRLSAIARAPAAPPRTEIKIYPLQEANAVEMGDLLRTLLEGRTIRVVADPRTNSVVAAAPREDLEVIQAILIRLDRRVEPPDGDRGRGARPGATMQDWYGRMPRVGRDPQERAQPSRFSGGGPLNVELQALPDQDQLALRGAAKDVQNVVDRLEENLASTVPQDAAATIRRLRREIEELKAQIELLKEVAEERESHEVPPPDAADATLQDLDGDGDLDLKFEMTP